MNSLFFGAATSETGVTSGVWGQAISPDGRGVYGESIAEEGPAYGIYGTAESPEGRGVFGWATSPTGTNFGGRFVSQGDTGRGVFGAGTSETGANCGVWGQSNSTSGKGVFGEAISMTGTTFGVHGMSMSSSPIAAGVLAQGAGAAGAAALEIRGAIRVPATGAAGSFPAPPGPGAIIDSWAGPPPEHSHCIGGYRDVSIPNPYFSPSSIVLVTVRGAPPPPGSSLTAQVLGVASGTATVRVTVLGDGGLLPPFTYPPTPFTIDYLILKP